MRRTAGTYDEAESTLAPDVTLAQWARAEALKAVLLTNISNRPPMVETMVNVYAELIITGGLPRPQAGMSWS